MTIQIDHAVAKRNLFEAHQFVMDGVEEDRESVKWKGLVDELGRICPYKKSSTFVAALGTAVLAKTVDINIDPYSLLGRGGGDRSYSARSLADNVWAKNRAYLEIDLGANGANPLNNIPFIGRDSIRAIERVRNQEGKDFLFFCLDELDTVKSIDSAKAALRGFVASRLKKSAKKFKAGKDAGDHLVVQTLAKIIDEFVRTDSEEGRRAQAVAAGLLTAVYGIDNVEVGHINDPDRHYPLDITVFEDRDQGTVRLSVEVKDKVITGSEILSSVEKVTEFGYTNIVYLAINKNQNTNDFTLEAERARDYGCKVVIFDEWLSFCNACVSNSSINGPQVFKEIYKAIGNMLVKLQVSQSGLDQWSHWA